VKSKRGASPTVIRGRAKSVLPELMSESDHQRVLCKWLDLKGVVWCHPPNGGWRGKYSSRIGAKLRREGLKPGVPDILVFTPPPKSKGKVGTAIELKKLGSTYCTPSQKLWIEDLKICGWEAQMCRGSKSAIEWLESLGY